jgi:DNA-binding Xre family transcriptional regulator
MIKHIYREAKRTPKEAALLRAEREHYQREKPTPEQLLAEGGHKEFVPLGELILLHQLMASLKKERQRQRVSLAALARRTGIDQAALSRLETGTNANPTLDTLYRIAVALDKEIICGLKDFPAERITKKSQLARSSRKS